MPRMYTTGPFGLKWQSCLLACGLLAGVFAELTNAQQLTPLPNSPAATPNQVQSPVGPAAVDVKLQVYDVPSNFIGTVGAQLQLRYRGDANVRVTTEPKTGQLMIMAPDAVHREIRTQISTFMQRNKIPAGDRGMNVASNKQQSYTLRNLSWRELEDAIQRLAGPRITVTTERDGELAKFQIANASGMRDIIQVDRRQNSVTMLGTGASVSAWFQVVTSLDKGQADRTKLTHIVPLAPAEPRGVQRAMRLVSATMQQGQGGGEQTEKSLDVGDEPATVLGTIESLGSGSGLIGDVQIEFIEELDLVIIRGSSRDVQRTLDVIEKIKQQAIETQPDVEVYPLKHANGEAVAALVTELYENIYAPRQGPVSITALGQPNALLLIGRKEVVRSVIELVDKIDQPLDSRNQLKVIRLIHASSVDLELRIREFFVQNPPDDEQRVALGTRIKVLADYRTNALIIQASPREMVEVEKLIQKLDVEDSSTENVVRVFRLKNTLAEDMQTVLEGVIGGQTTGGDEALAIPPSAKLSIVTVDGTRVESGVLAGVIITPDPSVNAIVVRAPASSMALIEKLIEELDHLPSAEAVIKVFRLQNGDATTLAQTLQALFGLSVTAGQGAQGNFLNNLSQSNLTTGGEGSLVQLQIAAEARTNSVIASGARSDLTVLEALVMRLDEDVVQSRRAEVIWLRNAFSVNVAAALTNYFGQLTLAQQNLNNGINQILSAQELVNRQVFAVADESTNSVLLSASPEQFKTAMRLIERLDRRPPMVSIQVLIAEIQLDDSFELGAEWGLQDGLLFDRLSATGGTLTSPVLALGNILTGPSGGPGLTQNLAGQALSSFGVGRSNATGQGGLVLSASSEAIGVLIRALQTANRLQILNRPHLVVLDQQIATTQVGSSVPRVNGITQAQLGVPQQTLVEDVEVGLLLSVQPRVNPDGLIMMEIGVENSSVGDPNAGIPIGFGANGEVIRSPIINRTRADSWISAYSGQTVVFAGLISKSRGSARSQIPILGSLPLIGPAFRFDVETEQRRELLVVLTPRLIQTDEDYEMMNQVESSRMSWCLADVLNLHGDVGLSGGNGLWGPAKSAMMQPDRQPMMLETKSSLSSPPTYDTPPMYQDSAPLGDIDGPFISPSMEPNLDSGASTEVPSPNFRPVGFTQPAQTASGGGRTGAQRGAYK